MPPGGAGSQGCLRLRGVVVRLQPSQHKEFPFFWQKKKDEILKAWLKGYCIDIIFFFLLLNTALVLLRETAASQSREGCPAREQGVGLKQGRKRRIVSGS